MHYGTVLSTSYNILGGIERHVLYMDTADSPCGCSKAICWSPLYLVSPAGAVLAAYACSKHTLQFGPQGLQE